VNPRATLDAAVAALNNGDEVEFWRVLERAVRRREEAAEADEDLMREVRGVLSVDRAVLAFERRRGAA
jgi:hypothetical protein